MVASGAALDLGGARCRLSALAFDHCAKCETWIVGRAPWPASPRPWPHVFERMADLIRAKQHRHLAEA